MPFKSNVHRKCLYTRLVDGQICELHWSRYNNLFFILEWSKPTSLYYSGQSIIDLYPYVVNSYVFQLLEKAKVFQHWRSNKVVNKYYLFLMSLMLIPLEDETSISQNRAIYFYLISGNFPEDINRKHFISSGSILVSSTYVH